MLDIYRTVVESTSDSIYMVDSRCCYLYVNPKHCLALGVPPGELVGRRYEDLHTPEETLAFTTDVAKVFQEGLSFQCEYRSHRDGKTFLRTFSPVRPAPGHQEIAAVSIISKDVTEWKHIEHLYETIAEKSPIGIYIAQDECFQWVNEKIRESTGYTTQEIIGVPCLSVVHPEDREWVRSHAVTMLRGETSLPYGYRFVTKSGDLLWYLETVMSITYNGRRAVLGSQMDITAQKQAEDALRESEERYRTIIDTIADAYYELDLAGNYVMFNDAYVNLHGYGREDIQGSNYRAYVDNKQADIAFRVFHQVFRTGRPVKKMGWEIITKGGETKQVELSISLVRDAQGRPKGFRGIISDITIRRKAEEAIRQQAFHDPLTGLSNRTLFYDRLHMAIKRAKRDKKLVAVIVLDLDYFKGVNDQWGHATGDALLQGVAGRLLEIVRASDTVARHGGDEFTLILPSLPHREDALRVARKIVRAFKEPFRFDACELTVTTSLGVALYPLHGENIDALMKNADMAMYRAKSMGRNQFCYGDGVDGIV